MLIPFSCLDISVLTFSVAFNTLFPGLSPEPVCSSSRSSSPRGGGSGGGGLGRPPAGRGPRRSPQRASVIWNQLSKYEASRKGG